MQKASKHWQNRTPNYFITTFNKKEDVLRAFEVGGNDFIEKPFERAVLKTRVENLLALRSLEKLKDLQKKEESALSMLATLSHEIINPLTVIKKETLTLKKINNQEIDASLVGIQEAVSKISTFFEKAKKINIQKMSEYSDGLKIFEVGEDERRRITRRVCSSFARDIAELEIMKKTLL